MSFRHIDETFKSVNQAEVIGPCIQWSRNFAPFRNIHSLVGRVEDGEKDVRAVLHTHTHTPQVNKQGTEQVHKRLPCFLFFTVKA